MGGPGREKGRAGRAPGAREDWVRGNRARGDDFGTGDGYEDIGPRLHGFDVLLKPAQELREDWEELLDILPVRCGLMDG